jgi:hypothetical protein
MESNQYYKNKYLKYKNKYLDLKNITENENTIENIIGDGDDLENLNFFLGFNENKNKYLEKYNLFYDINLINLPIKKIGQESANGFINLLEYKNNKDSNTFKAVLKSSLKLNADNNYYEFVVGNCINKIKEYFPNFAYTFLYMNPTDELKRELMTGKLNNPNLLKNLNIRPKININRLETFYNIGQGCIKNGNSSILLEYIPNSYGIDDILKDNDFLLNYDYNLFSIMFQVYAALVGLKDIYTHYDLHRDNVMIIKLPQKMIINYTNLSISLYTKYMPVIIDYGRSHIDCSKLNLHISSKKIADIACNTKKCNKNGKNNCNTIDKGLYVYKENDKYSDLPFFSYINMRTKNESFDSRYIIDMMFYKINENSLLRKKFLEIFNKYNNLEWFENIKKKDGTIVLSTKFGISEIPSSYNIGKLKTIVDIYEWLSDFYVSNKYYDIKFDIDDYYGTITINSNIDDNQKWSFQPK